jgi:hypothetical protein
MQLARHAVGQLMSRQLGELRLLTGFAVYIFLSHITCVSAALGSYKGSVLRDSALWQVLDQLCESHES